MFNAHNQVIEELRTRGRVDRPQLGMRLVTTDNREGKLNGVMVRARTTRKGGAGVMDVKAVSVVPGVFFSGCDKLRCASVCPSVSPKRCHIGCVRCSTHKNATSFSLKGAFVDGVCRRNNPVQSVGF